MMEERVRSYRDLRVWSQAIELIAAVYELTRAYPKDELYGLTSQTRRAATSIAANIAEGYGRATRPAFVNFLRIAQGSLKELETHLIVAERVKIAPRRSTGPLLARCDDLGRMLRGLIRKLSPELTT